jgi:hypothetical protein
VKVLLIILSTLLSLQLSSQKLNPVLFSDANAGFSINLTDEWKQDDSKNRASAFFANNKKNCIITVRLTKVSENVIPIYTKEEAANIKQELISMFKARNVSVSKILVFPGKFIGIDCMTSIAYIKDPELNNGRELYYKTIQLLHKNNLFNIIYSIPVSILNNNQILSIEKELQTMKFF